MCVSECMCEVGWGGVRGERGQGGCEGEGAGEDASSRVDELPFEALMSHFHALSSMTMTKLPLIRQISPGCFATAMNFATCSLLRQMR